MSNDPILPHGTKSGNRQHKSHGAPANARSILAEQVVLGAVFYDPPTLTTIRQMLKPADFGFTPHRFIFEAMCARQDKGEPFAHDMLLANDLAAHGLGRETALGIVSPLALACDNFTDAPKYCREVLKYALKAARQELAEISASALSPDADEDEIERESARVQERIADIKRRQLSGATGSDVWRPEIQSARDLLRKEIPAARWAVPDLFAEGLTLFAGKSKRGKSTLILHILSAVAVGGIALSRIHVERGEALYLALEDNERRMQERLQRQLDIDDADGAPEHLSLVYKWPRLDVGGIDALDRWMNDHPQTRIICIDTYKQVKPRQRTASMTLYDADYEALLPIQEWANRRHVAVVVIMHLRKSPAENDPFDEISGSTGVQGVADNMAVLREYNGQYQLHRRGRDYVDDEPWTLQGDRETLLWRIEDTDPMRTERLTAERATLYALLDKHPEGLTPKQIADKLGKSQQRDSVRMMLARAMNQAQGGLRRSEGRYYRERVTAVTESYRVTAVTESYRQQSPQSPESVTPPQETVTGRVTGIRPGIIPSEAASVTPVTPVTHVELTLCDVGVHAYALLRDATGRRLCVDCNTPELSTGA